MSVVAAPQKKTGGEASPVTEKKRKNWLAVAAQIFALQIVALLLVELVLSLSGLGEEEIFKLDKSLGFSHMPNKRVTWRSEGFAVSNFNADGMREPGLTVAKPEGVYRVALLGDSMVEGLQVPIEKSFGQLLQKPLTEETGKPVQFLNFATSGYSTAQEYLQLKSQVVKYRPDLVILCYNNRDLFENWAPPDQTLTNVRPYALHLPGQPLVIDNSSVIQWMKSPRGKFLTRIEWLREHSRIWGLIAAWETQASFHDPVYRAVCALFTQPGKTIKAWAASAAQVSPRAVLASLSPDRVLQAIFLNGKDKPSFQIQFFEDAERGQTKPGVVPSRPGSGSANNSSLSAGATSAKTSSISAKDGAQSSNTSSATAETGTGTEKSGTGTEKSGTARNTKELSLVSCLQNEPDLSLFPGNAKRAAAGAAESGTKAADSGAKQAASDAKQAASGAKAAVSSTGPSQSARNQIKQTSKDQGAPSTPQTDGRKTYLDLMSKTLGSLMKEMNHTCKNNGTRFAVIMLPVKAALTEGAPVSSSMLDITYEREIEIVSALCDAEKIPHYDCQASAAKLSEVEKRSLFHSVHFQEEGHQFMARTLRQFLGGIIKDNPDGHLKWQ